MDALKVVKEGWLEKEGGYIKSRKRRWMVLYSDGYLVYYTNAQRQKIKGTVELHARKVNKVLVKDHPYSFALSEASKRDTLPRATPPNGRTVKDRDRGRTYMMEADTHVDMIAWIEALSRFTMPTFDVPVPPVDDSALAFGRALSHSPDDSLPVVLTLCIARLEQPGKGGIDRDGLFRVSGNSNQIHSLRRAFDRGEDVDLNEVENPHNVAGLLKLFLKELPEPLCPFDLYDMFIDAAAIASEAGRLEAVSKAVRLLPPINYAVLETLMAFLVKVMERHTENRMNSKNIAMVFSPSIFRKRHEVLSSDIVRDMALASSLLETLLLNHSHVFEKVDAESSDEDVSPSPSLEPGHVRVARSRSVSDVDVGFASRRSTHHTCYSTEDGDAVDSDERAGPGAPRHPPEDADLAVPSRRPSKHAAGGSSGARGARVILAHDEADGEESALTCSGSESDRELTYVTGGLSDDDDGTDGADGGVDVDRNEKRDEDRGVSGSVTASLDGWTMVPASPWMPTLPAQRPPPGAGSAVAATLAIALGAAIPLARAEPAAECPAKEPAASLFSRWRQLFDHVHLVGGELTSRKMDAPSAHVPDPLPALGEEGAGRDDPSSYSEMCVSDDDAEMMRRAIARTSRDDKSSWRSSWSSKHESKRRPLPEPP